MGGVFGFMREMAAFAVVAGVSLAAVSCAQGPGEFDSESVVNASCAVATDQRGSFMARVESFPLIVQADSTFTPAERAAIDMAAAQWNLYGRQLMGQDFFVVQYAKLGRHFYDSDPRDCSDDDWGSENTFAIVRETAQARWSKLRFTASIPAATLRCFARRTVHHQVVLTYMNAVDPPQLGSVIVHELGHTIGLDHSCLAEGGSEKFRSCAGLPEMHPYRSAVMYPTMRSRRSRHENPEIKDTLRENDRLRASCLYGPN